MKKLIEGEANTPQEHEINSLIMETASDFAGEITELICNINGTRVFKDEYADTLEYTEAAQDIFDLHYGDKMNELYKLFNRQLDVINRCEITFESLPKDYWDTVEKYLPYYYERNDVAYSNKLRALIDEEKDYREERTVEANKLDLKLYLEALAEKHAQEQQ